MDEKEIERRLLHDVWVYSQETDLVSFKCDVWCADNGFDLAIVWAIIHKLSDKGLVVEYADYTLSLTTQGSLHAIAIGAIPESYLEYLEKIHYAILKVCNEQADQWASIRPERVFELAGDAPAQFKRDIVWIQILRLESQGFITRQLQWMCRISALGQGHLQQHERLDRVKALWSACNSNEYSVSVRGRKLEQLFGDLAEIDNATVERGRRTPFEENDLLISWESEYWLASCKWLSRPVGGCHLAELQVRINDRRKVQGILVSVSGFTKSAIHKSVVRMHSAFIVLITKSDIEALIREDITLRGLLKMRTRSLLTQERAGVEPSPF